MRLPFSIQIVMGIAVMTVAGAVSQAAPGRFLAACGRSPIPEPGEHLTHPLPARRLGRIAPLSQHPAPAAGAVVPWYEATRHMGQTLTIEGKVVVTHDIGSLCFLNFATDWRGKFYIVVYKSVYHALPAPPEDYFRNRTIRVTGKVVLHNDNPKRPQMEVHRAADIRVVK